MKTIYAILAIACLPSCSQFSKLPPETQAAIKAAALEGAKLAADAAAKAVVAAINKKINEMP